VSEVVGPGYNAPEESNPEAILQFLSAHREGLGVERRPRPRPSRRRTRAVLGLVAAVALVGGSVFVWKHFAQPQSVSPSATHDTAPAARSKERARGTAAVKKQKPAVTPVRPAGAAPWNRGLQPLGHSTGRHLPGFYYAWVTSHVSCARYATYGCWKLDVVTRHGCPNGLVVVAQEMNGGTVEGTTWGIGPRARSRARVVVELDADRKNVRPQLDSLFCRPRS
jgi:hypothetical protein